MNRWRTWRSAMALILLSIMLLIPVSPSQAESKLPTTVCFQPLGNYDESLLKKAEWGVTHVYGFATERLTDKPMPEAAFVKKRKRWRADTILEALHAQRPPVRCTFVMGFTREDVSTTAHGHEDWGILGMAEIGGRMGVVSSFRTHKKLKRPHTAARRVVKVTNHELGHLLGIPHLRDASHPDGSGKCLMNDAEGSVLSTDEESGLLCPATRHWLEEERGVALPEREAMGWEEMER